MQQAEALHSITSRSDCAPNSGPELERGIEQSGVVTWQDLTTARLVPMENRKICLRSSPYFLLSSSLTTPAT
jgi:hypothetical protein